MKNFIKQNWFKLAIMLLIIIFGTYYFTITIPNQNFDKKTENCRKIAEEYRKNEIKESPNLIFYSPIYIYNKKINACLYNGGFIDPDTDLINVTKYIRNLNTNEEIINSTYFGDKIMYGVSNSEFSGKELELFGKEY